jgi:hypothetical protein
MHQANLYTCSVTRKPDAPAPTKFNIKLGTVTIMPESEDGEEQVVDEWLSRKVGQIIPPFEQCDVNKTDITHPNDPIELWPRAPVAVQPTFREKDHNLVFQVAKKNVTSRQVQCSFPYDLDETITLGNSLSDQIP